ncbi:hypothetical protein, partial [Escherichia coli]|uniref:hypothetical protein n=1 Tax=Escherichia coli TaxID=562 RepID=UPI001BFC0A8E
GKNSLNRLIRCVCGKKIGPDPRNFNQRVSLGRNDLLIRTFLKTVCISNGTGLHAFVPYPEEFSNCITVFPPEIQNKVGTKDFINAHGWSGSAIPMSNISPDDVLAACYKLLNKK